MKQFFRTIKQTFTSKEVYLNAQQESGWKGIKLLLKVVFLIGVVVGGIAVIFLAVFTPTIHSKVATFTHALYPEGLVVTFTDGVMTTNTEGPVSIALPQSWSNDSRDKKEMPANLLVLAPQEDASVTTLQTYDTVALAGKSALIAGTDGEFRTYTYLKNQETITKDTFVAFVNKVLRVATTAVLILSIPMVVLIGIGFLVGQLIWLLVISLVLWCIFKLMHQPLRYKQIYRMGLYALVPVLLLDIIALPLGFAGELWTMAVVTVILIVVTRSPQQTVEHIETV